MNYAASETREKLLLQIVFQSFSAVLQLQHEASGFYRSLWEIFLVCVWFQRISQLFQCSNIITV